MNHSNTNALPDDVDPLVLISSEAQEQGTTPVQRQSNALTARMTECTQATYSEHDIEEARQMYPKIKELWLSVGELDNSPYMTFGPLDERHQGPKSAIDHKAIREKLEWAYYDNAFMEVIPREIAYSVRTANVLNDFLETYSQSDMHTKQSMLSEALQVAEHCLGEYRQKLEMIAGISEG